MKIYFEDGQVRLPNTLPFKYDHLVDAGEGYSFCEYALKWILENDPESVVYTNHLGALSNCFVWNNKENAPEIYMRRNYTDEFVRVDVLAGGRIRRAQNVMAMYRAGVFGNVDPELFEIKVP